MTSKTVNAKLIQSVGGLDYTHRRGVTIMDFSSSWCTPCRKQIPIIEELAAMFKGKVRFLALDVDEHPQSAMNFGITSIPTIVIYRDGIEIERFIGCQAADTLAAAIYRTLVEKKEAKR